MSPPKLTCWARYDPETLRFTGEHQLLLQHDFPKLGKHWQVINDRLAFTRLSGTLSWDSLCCINGRVVEMDPKVDLKYLTYISSETWPELTLIDPLWTRVPYVPLDVPRIEPDNWDLFWELWNKQSDKIQASKLKNDPVVWQGLTCWLNPKCDPRVFNYNSAVVDDWSQYFPKMFEQIRNCVPWYEIEKVVLWQNVAEVLPHFDPDAFVYPWPDSLRIMIWDSNTEPTFWLSRWPGQSKLSMPIISQRSGVYYGPGYRGANVLEKIYVDLPKETNTFVFNNGAYLHGADLSKPKIIMAVKGRPILEKWLPHLKSSFEKYQDRIPL